MSAVRIKTEMDGITERATRVHQMRSALNRVKPLYEMVSMSY
jgi:hypothetical protein